MTFRQGNGGRTTRISNGNLGGKEEKGEREEKVDKEGGKIKVLAGNNEQRGRASNSIDFFGRQQWRNWGTKQDAGITSWGLRHNCSVIH